MFQYLSEKKRKTKGVIKRNKIQMAKLIILKEKKEDFKWVLYE